jgi:RNA-directed DNA polymerase
MVTTEKPYNTATKLERIAMLSGEDKGKEFTALMHLFNPESLLGCFHELDGKKATGIDNITKDEYGKNLHKNIDDLISRMKRMAYIPSPVREVLIPKEGGKPGATRPLGISNLEDKIVQKMTQKILEAIYEPIFLDCSYGFRPGRGCHDAIKALHKHLFYNDVEVIIDIDLGNFFGTIDHQRMKELLSERIKDPKFLRYIDRMFKAGVLAEGDLRIDEFGVPQGSVCSPIMSNIYAHYVIDEWVMETVRPRCKGKITLFRYADDAVICCQNADDAKRIREVLGKRLNKYGLKLNEEKTKMINFSKKKAAMGIRQETFDFLGFTFYWGLSRKGHYIPKIKTVKKRLRNKLKKVSEWMKRVRNKMKFKEIWNRFCAKLRGHNQYYGVSHNSKQISVFFCEATRIFFKWINRRSQKKSMNWEQFKKFLKANPMPQPVIVHKLF